MAVAGTGAAVATDSPFFRGARELSAYFRESECATRRRLRRREFPYIKMGKMILVRKKDVEARLDELTVPARGVRKMRRA